GLLEPISSELHHGATDPLWKSLAAVDAYRRQFASIPETLTNTILMGSLLVPLGISLRPPRGSNGARHVPGTAEGPARQRRPPLPRLGDLPPARRDVERLRQIVRPQRRIKGLSPRPPAHRPPAPPGVLPEARTARRSPRGPPGT